MTSDEDELDDDDDLDPECAECGCDLFTEYHEWDCSYYGEDDEGDGDAEDDDED